MLVANLNGKLGLSLDSFDRPAELRQQRGRADDPRILYARSYLLTRTLVGVVGFALPTALFIVDALFLKGSGPVRGSISAYYHSAAHDLFVGGLCVIGVLLGTYMSGQMRTWDFWLSFIAGIAVIGVAFFPTGRPGQPRPLCGPETHPQPVDCSSIQQRLGETQTQVVHFSSACLFIICLAIMCFTFAYRARTHDNNDVLVRIYQLCGWLIIVAIAWFVFSKLVKEIKLLGLTPLYVTEIVSVYAFAFAWLVNGRAIWRLLFGGSPAPLEQAGGGAEAVYRK